MVFKASRCDTALPVDDERPWERDPEVSFARPINGDVSLPIRENGRIVTVRSERLGDHGVQDAVALDSGRTHVGQQRVRNALLFGEISHYLPRVVTDRNQLETVPAKLFDATLQLDQLRAAERSPVC